MDQSLIDFYNKGRYLELEKILEPKLEIEGKLSWKESHLLLLVYAQLYFEDFNVKSSKLPLSGHPNLPGLYTDVGSVFLKREKVKIAKSLFKQALAINPKHLESLLGMAKIGLHEKEYAVTERFLEKAKNEIDKLTFDYFQTQSKVKYWLNNFDDALEASSRSLQQLNTPVPTANLNHAVILSDLRRFDEAIVFYKRAIEQKPNYDKAHQFLGQVYLHKGELESGWKDYQWRWKNPDFPSKKLKTSRPEYNFESTDGSRPRRLLVWGEQGLGEQILFGQALDHAQSDFPEILVGIDGRLAGLYQSRFPSIKFLDKAQVIPESDYDAYISFGSLAAHYFPSLESLGKIEFPYLVPSEKSIRIALSALRNFKKPSIGISWRSVSTQYGQLKSLTLSSFANIFENFSCDLVSLQYGKVNDEIDAHNQTSAVQIKQVPGVDFTNDLDFLAAVISQLDFVVTTSNVTAHLAGALGKRAIVIQPKGKTLWFWDHREQQNCLWYPSVRLVSEYDYGDDWLPQIREAVDSASNSEHVKRDSKKKC